jgi:hypothetical protein
LSGGKMRPDPQLRREIDNSGPDWDIFASMLRRIALRRQSP